MHSKVLVVVLSLAFSGALASAALAQAATSAAHDTTHATPPPPKPKPASNEPSKIYYGGTATVSIGTTTSIGFFPMIGYKFTPRISGGAEAGYEYVNFGEGQSTNNYGGSVFSRLRVGRNLYAHAEYQLMNYEIFTGPNQSERDWVPALLLGGGYVKPIGPRTSVYAEVLFDVLQDPNYPYEHWDPIVNVGVCVGF